MKITEFEQGQLVEFPNGYKTIVMSVWHKTDGTPGLIAFYNPEIFPPIFTDDKNSVEVAEEIIKISNGYS